jgi:repressor LexA
LGKASFHAHLGNTGHKKVLIFLAGSLFIRYAIRMSITRRQKEVLDFIGESLSKNGFSPSYEEIAHGLDLRSLATVHKHINNLQAKGLLQRTHNRSRSIDLTPDRAEPRNALSLKLVGQIAAGQPIDATELKEEISLGDIVGSKDVFALKVRGDSMRDDHILDGDFVLVEKTNAARQGEIVVAIVKGSDTTLKRFYIEGDTVRLQPANAEMKPIYVPAKSVAIQGRVLGIMRKY